MGYWSRELFWPPSGATNFALACYAGCPDATLWQKMAGLPWRCDAAHTMLGRLGMQFQHKTLQDMWPRGKVGKLLFRFFTLRSFALLKTSNNERFALSLFSKRVTWSNSLFCSLPKERQVANHSFTLLKKKSK